MASLQFSDLQNEVYAHTGLDSTDTTNQTNVNRWINYVQQDICSRKAWPFLYGRETITTVADYATGTVTINAGSATVTGSGTTFTSAMGNGQYYIQFSTANDWYQITTYNSAVSLTLATNYQQSTNDTSDADYIIRKFFYSLSSQCDEVIDMRNWNTPLKMQNIDARFVDQLIPNPQSTNSSYAYFTFGVDTSKNVVITPYPFPSDDRLIEVREKIRPTDMANSSDLPTIPNKYAYLIAWGAIGIGFAFLKQFDAASKWAKRYEDRILQMGREYRQSNDYMPVLTSIDSVQRSKWISLPTQYPLITGGN